MRSQDARHPPTIRPLPPRVWTIFYWIGRGGLATREQLARRFWPGADPAPAYRHLRRWRQAGYLVAQPGRDPQRATVLYALAARGAQALGLSPPEIAIGWPSRRMVAHLILGQAARLRLETMLAATGGAVLDWRDD